MRKESYLSIKLNFFLSLSHGEGLVKLSLWKASLQRVFGVEYRIETSSHGTMSIVFLKAASIPNNQI